MSDKPILFSGPMVRALLDGRKTQTRRVAKVKPGLTLADLNWTPEPDGVTRRAVFARDQIAEPRFVIGDRLYVREAWHAARSLDSTPPRDIPQDADIEHAATARNYAEIGLKGKLRPGIFLPRWASRITLIVTDVRVQRLQEISEEDAEAEGWPAPEDCAKSGVAEIKDAYPIGWFAHLWDSLNASRGYGWQENPWVIAITFRALTQSIDQIEKEAA